MRRTFSKGDAGDSVASGDLFTQRRKVDAKGAKKNRSKLTLRLCVNFAPLRETFVSL